MATLKSLLKTASKELRTVAIPHHPSKKPRKPTIETLSILRFTTPAIHIHDPNPANKLFRYLTTPTPSSCLTPKPHGNHLNTYVFPTHHTPTLHICRALTSIIISHTAQSGHTAFAVLHPLTPIFPNFDAYLLPFTMFPMVGLGTSSHSSLSPLAVCQYFMALQTYGILLPLANYVPLFVQGCAIERSQNFRYVRGKGETAAIAVRELVHAVNAGLLEEHISCEGKEIYAQQLETIRKWAYSHPTNRVVVSCVGGGETFAGYAQPSGSSERRTVAELLTPLPLSAPFPSSTRMHDSKSMILATNARERWHFLTFLDILSPNSRISSLATQNAALCQQLAAKCHTYILTCLDGRERGFQVCHWGGMDCLPVVVEMEIIEEGDGSRSIVAMRLVDEMSIRVSFKSLARASIGKVVCWRECCGLVESLGIFVCGVPGDQLAVADCSVWFVGFI